MYFTKESNAVLFCFFLRRAVKRWRYERDYCGVTLKAKLLILIPLPSEAAPKYHFNHTPKISGGLENVAQMNTANIPKLI